MQGAGPRTTRRTASASLQTPCAPADGHPWTTPTLHPSPISHNHPSIHLHLLQPSNPSPPTTSRASHPPQPAHCAHGSEISLRCGDVASLGYKILWCAIYLTSGSVVGRVRMPHGPRPWARRGGGTRGASRHSPRACRRAPAPSDWSCSQLRYSSVRESNDQAPASVSIAFERWPVGAHLVRGGADAAPRTVSGLGVGLERFQRPLRP